MKQDVDQSGAKALINKAQKILLAPSSPADGDSLGSALSLLLVLRKLGKDVTVVCTEKIPEYLLFLPYVNQIETELGGSRDFIVSLNTTSAEVDHMKYEVEQDKINIIVTPKKGQFTSNDVTFVDSAGDYDLIITVDTGDLVQLGKLYEENKAMFEHSTVLNIDHHASNGHFGSHNYLNFNVAATTQMIYKLMVDLEKEKGMNLIDEDVATLLLTGIVTDTGSFQHSNTSTEAFEDAAELLDRGARQQEIIKHIFKTKSLATLKLWGRVLSKIQYDDEFRMVYSTISLTDLEDTGATPDDSGGIIDELMSNAPKAEVVLLLKEKEPGFVSGSLRAPGDLADVSEIAGLLGGGGHKKAAGFRIRDKSLEEALEMAKQVIHDYMAEKLGSGRPRKMFPNLVQKPMQTIPAPSAGGEDMLLEDFRKRQNEDPAEKAIKEKSVHFFQDQDGQVKDQSSDEVTVGDVLSQLRKD